MTAAAADETVSAAAEAKAWPAWSLVLGRACVATNDDLGGMAIFQSCRSKLLRGHQALLDDQGSLLQSSAVLASCTIRNNCCMMTVAWGRPLHPHPHPTRAHYVRSDKRGPQAAWFLHIASNYKHEAQATAVALRSLCLSLTWT